MIVKIFTEMTRLNLHDFRSSMLEESEVFEMISLDEDGADFEAERQGVTIERRKRLKQHNCETNPSREITFYKHTKSKYKSKQERRLKAKAGKSFRHIYR